VEEQWVYRSLAALLCMFLSGLVSMRTSEIHLSGELTPEIYQSRRNHGDCY
jgi:hypothetical protein